MFARVALAAALSCALSQPARAGDRRPVAVIDLTGTRESTRIAVELGEALNNHVDLKPLDDLSMPSQLLGEIRDDEADRFDDVVRGLREAEAAFEARDWARAASTAATAANRLHTATPTKAVVELYAKLVFVQAEAMLGDRKTADSAQLFRLTSELDREWTPDPARTLPEVIAAFDAARRPLTTSGKIAVNGRGTVIVDGREVGTAPAWFDVTVGQHIVWVVGPDRDPRGALVTVVANRKEEIAIDDAPTSVVTKVRRARLTLHRAYDAADVTARATAMRDLSRLLNVRDAVLLSRANGLLVTQTWRDRAPGFSPHREFRERDRSADLLDALAPKRRPPEPDQIVFPKPPDPPKVWYKRARYWAAIGGAVGVIVGAVAGYRAWDRTIGLTRNLQFQLPEASSR